MNGKSGKNASVVGYEINFDSHLDTKGIPDIVMHLEEVKPGVIHALGDKDCLANKELVIVKIGRDTESPGAKPIISSGAGLNCIDIKISTRRYGNLIVSARCQNEDIFKLLVAESLAKQSPSPPVPKPVPTEGKKDLKPDRISNTPENLERAVKALLVAMVDGESLSKENTVVALNTEFGVTRPFFLWVKLLNYGISMGKLVHSPDRTYRFLKPGETPPAPSPEKEGGASKFWESGKKLQDEILLVLRIFFRIGGTSKILRTLLIPELNREFNLQATAGSWGQWLRLLIKKDLIWCKPGRYGLTPNGLALIGEVQSAGKPADAILPVSDKLAPTQKGQSLSADLMGDPQYLLNMLEEVAAENVAILNLHLAAAEHRLEVIHTAVVKRQSTAG